MRTTIRLDADVAAAVERLRREKSLGASRAVNELIRVGMREPVTRQAFAQCSERLGIAADVTNVEEALDSLEDSGHARARGLGH